MAQLTIKINGYAYTVGCEDGQESHLLAMAAEIENRIASIKALGGQSGESRLLVLAALLMADELHDQSIEMQTLRRVGGGSRAAQPDPAAQARLSALALRAEEIADAMARA